MYRKIKAIAFDLDGTIYFGNCVAEGAVETVAYFKDQGLHIVFFTNNSSSSRQQIFMKLSKMGFELDISSVYTSSYASALYINRLGLKNVYCIGSAGLKEELNSHGISINEDEKNIEAIVVGLDKNFDYSMLARGLNVWKPGVILIACNRDKNYPIEKDVIMPGCGAILAALETAAGKTADHLVGKPNTFMIELVTNDLNLESDSILVVGDNYDSDIEMANRYGCPSVLLNHNSKYNYKPDTIINTLTQLKDLIIL